MVLISQQLRRQRNANRHPSQPLVVVVLTVVSATRVYLMTHTATCVFVDTLSCARRDSTVVPRSAWPKAKETEDGDRRG